VVTVAAGLLSAGGADAVQMKDLGQQAGVSLATLYKYFPSKDYVLLAVCLSRYQEMASQVFAEKAGGGSAQSRAADHLRREFSALQQDRLLAAALTKVVRESRRSNGPIIEAIEHLHLQILLHAAAGSAPLSDQQQRVLPVVLDIFEAASLCWLTGDFSASDVDQQIEVGCALLALPDGTVDSELGRAAPDLRA
jgi:TetR/AcrR family transcriptional regulator, cholesterol catabolism regulator